MISDLRQRFNSSFTEAVYHDFLQALDHEVRTHIEFRPCETPVFLPADLLGEMVDASRSIIAQLHAPAYRLFSRRALPPEFDAPNEGEHPQFVQVDFALTAQPDGRIAPRLIELQGCPSLYAYQLFLARTYLRFFGANGLDQLDYLLSGLSEDQYVALLREVVVGDHDPAEAILLEIEPQRQKTLPDFNATETLLGIQTVCVTEVTRRGRHLYYRRDGREIRIRRIYNRVIPDELMRKRLPMSFDFRDDLDLEWAPSCSWYFRWSKFSLPHLNHRCVPRSWLLDEMPEVPLDLDNFVLKPLFSFAGAGVKVDVTLDDLKAISESARSGYLLQEKVVYAPVVQTPDEPSRVEARLMFIWPERAAEPIPVTILTRLSKGKMMGVDFNLNRTWVGSSCAFFPGPVA